MKVEVGQVWKLREPNKYLIEFIVVLGQVDSINYKVLFYNSACRWMEAVFYSDWPEHIDKYFYELKPPLSKLEKKLMDYPYGV